MAFMKDDSGKAKRLGKMEFPKKNVPVADDFEYSESDDDFKVAQSVPMAGKIPQELQDVIDSLGLSPDQIIGFGQKLKEQSSGAALAENEEQEMPEMEIEIGPSEEMA